jgi:hypothetical protein
MCLAIIPPLPTPTPRSRQDFLHDGAHGFLVALDLVQERAQLLRPHAPQPLVVREPQLEQSAQPPEIAIDPGQLLDALVVEHGTDFEACAHPQQEGG